MLSNFTVFDIISIPQPRGRQYQHEAISLIYPPPSFTYLQLIYPPSFTYLRLTPTFCGILAIYPAEVVRCISLLQIPANHTLKI